MRASAQQRGLSLVELMVGIAVGLFIVTAATLIVTTQLADNRVLLLEAQLQQDLRATADIVTRELRRAGSAGTTNIPQDGIWRPGGAGVTANTFSALSPTDPANAGSEVEFRYRRSPGAEGPFGFKLESGALKSYIGTGWQELTDAQVMRVTNFVITPMAPLEYIVPCPRICADNTTDCWPRLQVRGYTVEISAQARTDASIARSIRSEVRLRNDNVAIDATLAPQACPV
jgi:type IV pilus assembly protein PilW